MPAEATALVTGAGVDYAKIKSTLDRNHGVTGSKVIYGERWNEKNARRVTETANMLLISSGSTCNMSTEAHCHWEDCGSKPMEHEGQLLLRISAYVASLSVSLSLLSLSLALSLSLSLSHTHTLVLPHSQVCSVLVQTIPGGRRQRRRTAAGKAIKRKLINPIATGCVRTNMPVWCNENVEGSK